MIGEGLSLTVVGMAVVFSFLGAMVLMMVLTARIMARFFPSTDPDEAPLADDEDISGESQQAAADCERAVALAVALHARSLALGKARS